MAKVVMVLAQGPGLPEGSLDERIELRACLTPQGRIDLDAWKADPEPWRATRRGAGGVERVGELVWCDDRWTWRGPDGDDGPVWALDIAVVRPGDIVTLRRDRGAPSLFRIVAVERD